MRTLGPCAWGTQLCGRCHPPTQGKQRRFRTTLNGGLDSCEHVPFHPGDHLLDGL